jgi:hypothetical protein
MGSQIRQVGLTVFAAGAEMLAPLLAATRQFAASGDALAKMASRTLSADDITGAVTILGSFIRLEWTRGVAWAENLLQAFAGGVAKLFLHVGFGINTAFWTVVDGIQTAIEWVIAGIVKLFTTALGTVASKVSALLELVGAHDAGTAALIKNVPVAEGCGWSISPRRSPAIRRRIFLWLSNFCATLAETTQVYVPAARRQGQPCPRKCPRDRCPRGDMPCPRNVPAKSGLF